MHHSRPTSGLSQNVMYGIDNIFRFFSGNVMTTFFSFPKLTFTGAGRQVPLLFMHDLFQLRGPHSYGWWKVYRSAMLEDDQGYVNVPLQMLSG